MLNPHQILIIAAMYLEGIVFEDYECIKIAERMVSWDEIGEIFPTCDSFETEVRKLSRTFKLIDDHGKRLNAISLNRHGVALAIDFFDNFENYNIPQKNIVIEYIRNKLSKISTQRFMRYPPLERLRKSIWESQEELGKFN